MRQIDWFITELTVMGGAETYVGRMAATLRQRGWQIRVITLVDGGTLAAELAKQGVPLISLGMQSLFDMRALFKLYQLWKTDPPDLVHTHLFHAGIIGRMVAKWAGITTVVVHQHGPEANRPRWRTLIDRFTQSFVDAYVATCAAIGQVMMQRESIPARKLHVIYNGLDLPAPHQPTRPQNWPIANGAFVIGCVGRLSREKGQIYLLDAVQQLRRRGHNIALILLGDGLEREHLSAHAQKLNIANHIHFMGVQENIADWLAYLDLFVLPSQWEGVSLALLEAMAAGVPVISTTVGGTPEVIVHEATGLLVPPADVTALAQAIEQLWSDPVQRHALAQAGQARVLQCFSISQTLDQTEQLYEQLLYG